MDIFSNTHNIVFCESYVLLCIVIKLCGFLTEYTEIFSCMAAVKLHNFVPATSGYYMVDSH